jgi:hypothetical protein
MILDEGNALVYEKRGNPNPRDKAHAVNLITEHLEATGKLMIRPPITPGTLVSIVELNEAVSQRSQMLLYKVCLFLDRIFTDIPKVGRPGTPAKEWILIWP